MEKSEMRSAAIFALEDIYKNNLANPPAEKHSQTLSQSSWNSSGKHLKIVAALTVLEYKIDPGLQLLFQKTII